MAEAMRFIGWFAATGLLVGSSWLTVRRVFPGDAWCVRWMHVIVLSWAVVVGNALTLGACGVLYPIALLIGAPLSATLVWVVVWLCHGRSGGRAVDAEVASSAGTGPRVRPGLETFGREVCGVGDPRTTAESGTALEPGTTENRPASTQWQRVAKLGSEWGWAVAWTCLAAVGLAHVLWNGIASFPKDWDSLAYHIPLVDHWLRERTLYVPDCAFWYCPGNNELWALWFAAPFSGDYSVALNNLPATVLLAVAAVELGRLLGLSRAMYHLAAMAILATTPVIRQLISQENDVAVVALFLGALLYGIRYARDGRLADGVFGAACGGLLAGLKYYALGYAGVALLGVVGLSFASRGWPVAVRTLAIGLIGGLLLGSYWYLRNAWLTGTPLFPKGLTASTDVWSAMRPESHTSTLLRSGRWAVWPLLADAIGVKAGPCVLAAVMLLPGTLAWLVVLQRFSRSQALPGNGLRGRLGLRVGAESARQSLPDSAFPGGAWEREAKAWEREASRAAGARPGLRGWLAMVILLSGAVFLVTPNTVETLPGSMNMLRYQYHPVRFGMSFFAVATLGLAWLVDDVARALAWPFAQGIYALAGAGVGYQIIRHVPELPDVDVWLLAVVIAECGAVLFLLGTAESKRLRVLLWVLMLSAAPAIGWACHVRATGWHANFFQNYDTQFQVDMFSVASRWNPERERICLCDERYYPFLGSRRQFDVCRPLWTPDYAAFLRYLQNNAVSIVVARRRDPGGLPRYVSVLDWITAPGDVFSPLHQDQLYTAVRVDGARLARALAACESAGVTPRSGVRPRDPTPAQIVGPAKRN
jgi:hypothetical protein